MKTLLMIIGCGVSAALWSQGFEPDIQKLLKQKVGKMPDVSARFNLKIIPPLIKDNRQPKIYALPQDYMPYIVPDSVSIAAIPNSGKGYQFPLAGRMPGAGNNKNIFITPLSKR